MTDPFHRDLPPATAAEWVARGLAQLRGLDVPRDPKAAAASFAEAAAAGDAQGMHLYARCLRAGVGVKRDEARAATLTRAASDAGLRDARADLALVLYRGQGTARDLAEAEALFTSLDDAASRYWLDAIAAERGGPEAQHQMALRFMDLAQPYADPVEGLRLLRLAAEGGHAPAWLQLSRAYALGLGVEPDLEEAERLRARAG
jgi:hypothetical protein